MTTKAKKAPERFTLTVKLDDDYMANHLSIGLHHIFQEVHFRIVREAAGVGWEMTLRDENGNRIGEAKIE